MRVTGSLVGNSNGGYDANLGISKLIGNSNYYIRAAASITADMKTLEVRNRAAMVDCNIKYLLLRFSRLYDPKVSNTATAEARLQYYANNAKTWFAGLKFSYIKMQVPSISNSPYGQYQLSLGCIYPKGGVVLDVINSPKSKTTTVNLNLSRILFKLNEGNTTLRGSISGCYSFGPDYVGDRRRINCTVGFKIYHEL